MATLSLPTNTPATDGAVIGCTTDDTTGTAYAMARTDRQWYSVANGDSQALADADKATIIAQDITAPELVWAGTDEDLTSVELAVTGLAENAGPFYVGWVQGSEAPPDSVTTVFTTTIAPYTLGRASKQWAKDLDGVLRFSDSGVQAHVGARKVTNDLPLDVTQSPWLAYDGATHEVISGGGPNGEDCVKVTFGTGTSDRYAVSVDMLEKYGAGLNDVESTYWVKADSNTTCRLYSATTASQFNISTTWQRLSYPNNREFVGPATFGIRNNATGNSAPVYLCLPQCEVVTNQANKNPAEVVDGTAFFDTTNGNTVSSSVVVEAEGTALTTLEGVLLERTATNLLVDPTAPATQDVTVTAVEHTLSMLGTGSLTLSGVGSGTATEAAPLTFTPTAGTLTVTVVGTVDKEQLETKAYATSFIDGVRDDTELYSTFAELGLPADLVQNITMQVVIRTPCANAQVPSTTYLASLYESSQNRVGVYLTNISSGEIGALKTAGGVTGTFNLSGASYAKGDRLSIVVRLDSTGMSLSVDGGEVTTLSSGSATTPFTQPLVSAWGGSLGGSQFGNCVLESQRIWDRALTDQEMRALS